MTLANQEQPLLGSETAHVGDNTEALAQKIQQEYLDFRANSRENPYLKSHLGQIVKVERDDEGKLTGRATVHILTLPKNSMRVSVLMPITASQYMFFGGLPPENTLCLLSWLPQGIGVITAYYPMKWREMINASRWPDLAAGEIYVQSEVRRNGLAAPGATIRLDADGNVTIQDEQKNSTITMNVSGEITIESSEKVTVQSSRVTVESGDVNLGGESGKQLVTQDFLTDVFNSHTHTGVQTGAGATSTPLPVATAQFTLKTKSE
jgi:hypothetical protein